MKCESATTGHSCCQFEAQGEEEKRLGVKTDTRWLYDSFFSSLSVTGSEEQNIAKPKVSLNSHDARLQSCPTKFMYSTTLEERH